MLLRPVASVSIWHDASGALPKCTYIGVAGNPASDAAIAELKKSDALAFVPPPPPPLDFTGL